MSLPESIQRQIDEANAMLNKEPNPEEVTAGKPVESDKVEKSELGSPVEAPQEAPIEEESNTVEQKQSEPQKDDRENSVEYWKARANTVIGKFNKEVKEANERAKAAELRVAELEAMAKSNSTSSEDEPLASEDESLKRLREEYGDDFVDLALKVGSRNDTSKEIEERLAQMEEQQVINQKQREAEDEARFHADLKAQVPNYQEIDVEDGFIEFLDRSDPILGKSYKEALGEAVRDKDSYRTAQIFNLYQSQKAPETQPQQAQAQNLAAIAQPDVSRADIQPNNNGHENRVITRGEIAQFYKDVATGAYKGREDERKSMDNLIQKAVQEKRVV